MGSKSSKPVFTMTYALHDNPAAATHNKMITYYINLDRRTDRKKEMESELTKVDALSPYIRFPAIQYKPGAIGCTLSHIEVLKLGLQSGVDHICVFEDDFYFKLSPKMMEQLIQAAKQMLYDVFMFGYCIEDVANSTQPTNHSLFVNIKNACCSHGYMVRKEYAPKLIENLQEGVRQLIRTKNEQLYALDKYWKRLQEADMWITYKEGPCGLQRAGYSDIDLKHKGESVTTN